MSNQPVNRKVRSMRGEIVDFDLFDIKQQMDSAPATEEIKQRERFIDAKRKRGTRRKLQEMLAQQQVSQSTIKRALEKQAAEAAEAEQASGETVVVEEKVEASVEAAPETRRKMKIK